MLHRDESFAFIKRWNELERAGREIDYARSKWAHELRSKFARGESGDDEFRKWCADEIGLSYSGASELLERAAAIGDVPDEPTWTRVGGFQQVRQLAALPKPQRVPIIEAAKSSDRNIRAVLRERKLIEPQERRSPYIDATELATFIAESGVHTPSKIARIVARYVASKRAA